MIGRVLEYNHLNSLYNSDSFEYLVMFGRRRVGKTTLLQEFASKNNAIYYPAQEKNDALEYINDKATTRMALIIDEFLFIADENPTIKSIFQYTIDHKWKKNKNIF